MKRLERIAETLTGNIKPLDDISGAVESMILALTGPVASWAASIPNIVMVSRSAQEIFSLDAGLSYAVAVSLEFIGQSLVGNWTRAAQWNSTKKSGDLPARVGLAKSLMVGYFALDIVMVSTLACTQYAESGQWQIFTALIYPVISIFTAIATNQRAHLFRLEKQSEQQTAQRKADRVQRKARKQAENVPNCTKLNGIEAANESRSEQRGQAVERLLNGYMDDPMLSYAQVAERCGRSKSWVAGEVKRLIAEGAIKKNGQGVEILEQVK